MDSEKIIEARLVRESKVLGGRAMKWESPGNKGVPDRLLFLPNARFYLIELKSEKKTLAPLQLFWRRWFLKLGFDHRVIDTYKKLEEFIDELRTAQLPGNSL